jgi:hypothetical protein
MPHISHPSCYDLPDDIMGILDIMKLIIIGYYNFFLPPVTLSLLGPSILLSTVFSNTLV